MTATLEELVEAGQVEYAVIFGEPLDERDARFAAEAFRQGVRMGKTLTLERYAIWLESQPCGNDGGCMIMSVIRRMCVRCQAQWYVKAELRDLRLAPATGRGAQAAPTQKQEPGV